MFTRRLYIYGLVALFFAIGQQVRAEDSGRERFEGHVAGAYFFQFDASATADLLPESLFLPAITTIHGDGTLLALDGVDDRLGGRLGLSINSRSQGNWQRVGRRSILAKTLYFNITSDTGGRFERSGRLQGITRLVLLLRFDNGFESGTGVACQQYLPMTEAGFYDPQSDNPLQRLPDIDCNDQYVDAFPFTFWSIR